MNLKETDLPGIGKKFVVTTRSGDKLVIIVHDDGRRELYHFKHDDEEESISMVTLDDDEARHISAIVGGINYKPKALETIEVALDDLIIEWYRIESGFKCVGLSIGELNVRQQSGATIIALIDPTHGKTINPGPDVVITANSMLVALGERQHQKRLRQVLLNGGG
ncbi:potassium:proton antiporter [Paenibacillus yonginensis]|uniref:Potassium:proton antiporter n=1 Tax=Paenibacillus yonginensis TaxID=1462996 RepID=A0A1B1N2T9_9BACL|nr:cation:proton antiporter regulatory subunit [Paenibacillus yonginensis]ANS75751.1 potassium:proton antiporter [Paenibacillus yonginensis]